MHGNATSALRLHYNRTETHYVCTTIALRLYYDRTETQYERTTIAGFRTVLFLERVFLSTQLMLLSASPGGVQRVRVGIIQGGPKVTANGMYMLTF